MDWEETSPSEIRLEQMVVRTLEYVINMLFWIVRSKLQRGWFAQAGVASAGSTFARMNFVCAVIVWCLSWFAQVCILFVL